MPLLLSWIQYSNKQSAILLADIRRGHLGKSCKVTAGNNERIGNEIALLGVYTHNKFNGEVISNSLGYRGRVIIGLISLTTNEQDKNMPSCLPSVGTREASGSSFDVLAAVVVLQAGLNPSSWAPQIKSCDACGHQTYSSWI